MQNNEQSRIKNPAPGTFTDACKQQHEYPSLAIYTPYGCISTKNNEKEILQCTLFCSWEHRHRNLTLHFSCYITQKDN